jgi:hypothetical protein
VNDLKSDNEGVSGLGLGPCPTSENLGLGRLVLLVHVPPLWDLFLLVE